MAASTNYGRALHVRGVKRNILEYCIEENSIIGSTADPDCRCVRITQSEDARSERGHELALSEAVKPNALVWAAIPCTGGSAWQHVNKRFASARKM